MHNDHVCFRANHKRIASLDPQFNPVLDFKKRDSGLSAAPLLGHGNRFSAYTNGRVNCCNLHTGAQIWEAHIPEVVFEMFIAKGLLLLSNHRQISILDSESGQFIKQIQIPANLGNAVLLENQLIWNAYDNNRNLLLFFNIDTLALEQEYLLDDLASFVLSDGSAILYNQYPDLIKSLNPLDLQTKWQIDIKTGNGAHFVNEYPFVIGDHLYISQFPDKFKKIALLDGQVIWEYSAHTGTNSFPSQYYLDNTLGYLSGKMFVILDHQSGEVLAQYDLSGIQQLKENVFAISYFTQESVFLYAQKAGIVLEISLPTLSLKYSFKTQKGLKGAPMIASNTVFLHDIEGTLYY